jgi:uncharacterized membrane protein YcaP (DUF421 family)
MIAPINPTDFSVFLAATDPHIHGFEIWQFPADLFQLDISIVEKVIRSVAVYVFLLVVFRLAGKRQLAQINTMDLIVLLTISNTVQNAIIGPDTSLLGGLIGAAALVGANALLVHFLYKKPELSKLIEGTPTILMENGQLIEAHLKSEEVTQQELLETAQQQGYASLDELETITLETSGNLSFIPRKPTNEDLRYKEVLDRLEALMSELSQLKMEKRNDSE